MAEVEANDSGDCPEAVTSRQAWMKQRFGRRYGRGARFLSRAWDAADRYFKGRAYGDHAMALIMDQIVRVQRLGDRIITQEQRDQTLATMWEALERIAEHSNTFGREEPPGPELTGTSVEFKDYVNFCQGQWEPPCEDFDVQPEPAMIRPEIAPVRHTPEAWEALVEAVEEKPEEVVQTYRVLWQLWRLRDGAKFLSWIN